MRRPHVVALASSLFFSTVAADLNAGEIKVISSIGFKPAVEHLTQKFTASTGHTFAVECGTSNALKYTILSSTRFDIAILTPSVSKELADSGHLVKLATNIARSGVGVAVRTGSPKPGISNG